MAGKAPKDLLLTVGHGTLDGEAFADLLANAGVERLVDVRRHPGSRRHPQFGHDALASTLAERGIGYRWDEDLGGRRKTSGDSPHVALRDRSFRGYADHMGTATFRGAIERLLADADAATTTVMCAESVWWRCHRRLIADHLVLGRGIAVEHLLHDGRRQPHAPTEGARSNDSEVVYDVGVTPPLG